VVEDPTPRGRLLEGPALERRLDAFERELRSLARSGEPVECGARPAFAHLEELSAALDGLVERVERMAGR
jgi:hypothetical protein